MGAKIYSDVKGNACEKCGGKFNKYVEFNRKNKENILFPVCNVCGNSPSRYRIRAKISDQIGRTKYVFIRKTLDNQPIDDTDVALDIFKRVEADEIMGKFRHTDYDKKSVKNSDLFKNVVASYLALQEIRNDLSPYSLDSKRKYSKILISFFGDFSVHEIEVHHIDDFKIKEKSYSNRAMCLGTLKTILRWAETRYKIRKIPKFEVPSNKKRKSVPDLGATRESVIPSIENEIHREAIRMLAYYGFRPSEVRAIQYEQIDLSKGRIVIDRHFSKTTLLMGRKSASEGQEVASIDRPISEELMVFIKSRPWPLDPKTFLFTNSIGKPLGVKDLSRTWKETLEKLSLPHVEMYGLRGARITEVLIESNGNITTARDFAGHSSANTTMSNYDHSSRNVDDVFKKKPS